jgi:hypothetical protein
VSGYARDELTVSFETLTDSLSKQSCRSNASRDRRIHQNDYACVFRCLDMFVSVFVDGYVRSRLRQTVEIGLREDG